MEPPTVNELWVGVKDVEAYEGQLNQSRVIAPTPRLPRTAETVRKWETRVDVRNLAE